MAVAEPAHASKRSRAASPRRYGCETPRVFTPPLRDLNEQTSLGFQCIEFANDVCGVQLFPWQKWLLIHALELDPALTVDTMDRRGRLDPLFRFRKVIVLVARQNGKSTLSQVLSLFFLYVLGSALVLGTAQDLDTAEEVWDGALEIIEETPALAALADKPVKTNGKKAIRLKTGERYKVKAANRKAGRGLSGDLVLLDELREHQTWDAWGAITKTTNARPAAQIWALSNAGDTTSVVLRYLRKMAHEALGDPDGICAAADPAALLPSDDDVDVIVDLADENLGDLDAEDFAEEPDQLGIFEWSAPPGLPVDDVDGILQANPSTNHGVSLRTLLGDAKSDPEWVFRTEVLCQWSEGTLQGPFPPGAWEAGQVLDAEAAPQIVGDVVAGLGMSADRAQTVIAFAGRDEDGRAQVEIVARRGGTDWVEGWLSERRGIVTGIGGQGRGAPESALIESLGLAGLPVQPIAGSDLSGATGAFYDAVRHNTVTHLAHPALDAAAQTAVPKVLEGGAILWDRKRSPIDISALQAATCALWLLERPVEAPAVSVYEARGVMTI